MQSKVFILLAIVAFVAAKPTNVEPAAAQEVQLAVEVVSDTENSVRCLNLLVNRGQRSDEASAEESAAVAQAKFLCKTTSTTPATTTTAATTTTTMKPAK